MIILAELSFNLNYGIKLPFLKDHNKTALVCNNRNISYSEVLRETAFLSSLFPAIGNLKVCIFSENRPEWVYSIYSAWNMNAIPVIFDHTGEIDEIVFILNEALPELIFCSQSCKKRLESIIPLISFTPEIIVFEDLGLKCHNAVSIREIVPSEVQKTALIAYTSGTTGSPKGVMLSFNDLLSNIQPILELGGREDAVLAILPFYHTFPMLWTMVLPLYVGAAIVFAKSLAPKDIMQAMQENKVTAVIGVPKLFRLIREKVLEEIEKSIWKKGALFAARKVNSLWFSGLIFRRVQKRFGGHIRYLICGGAEIEREVEEDFRTLGFLLQTGYGLTETSPMISFNRPGRIKIGSAGEPLPCNDVRIVDGEIAVRGENVMRGYYLKEAETSAVLKDGWFYTGDMGRLDEDGYLFVTGRKDDMIVLSNGKNIDPAKIEAGILSVSELVKEAAVVKNGDKLYAFIYPDYSKFSCSSQMIRGEIKWKVISKYNMTVPDYRKITSFELTKEELPKTLLGKVRRFKLVPKCPVSDSEEGMKSGTAKDEVNALTKYLSREKKVEAKPHSHIEFDIGLDSLDKVLLLSFIESSFGVKMTEEELKQHATLKELIGYINKVKEDEELKEAEWKRLLSDTEGITIPNAWFTLTLLQAFFRLFFKLYCRIKITGLREIPDSPVLFVPNHQCSLDQFIVSCLLKRRAFLDTFYLAKKKHYRKPWKTLLAERHNTVLVEIEKDLKLSLQKLAACLNRGKNVMIFPEGTRSVDGSLGNFKTAYAILSCALGVPVIPVVINGSKELLPKGTLFPKAFRKFTVEYLPPVYPDGMTASELNELVFEVMKKKIY